MISHTDNDARDRNMMLMMNQKLEDTIATKIKRQREPIVEVK